LQFAAANLSAASSRPGQLSHQQTPINKTTINWVGEMSGLGVCLPGTLHNLLFADVLSASHSIGRGRDYISDGGDIQQYYVCWGFIGVSWVGSTAGGRKSSSLDCIAEQFYCNESAPSWACPASSHRNTGWDLRGISNYIKERIELNERQLVRQLVAHLKQTIEEIGAEHGYDREHA